MATRRWDLYRVNMDTGHIVQWPDQTRRNIGTRVFYSLADNLGASRQAANDAANRAVAVLLVEPVAPAAWTLCGATEIPETADNAAGPYRFHAEPAAAFNPKLNVGSDSSVA